MLKSLNVIAMIQNRIMITKGQTKGDKTMRVKITKTKVYKFEELSQEGKTMKKHHDFAPADRYHYDFGICSSKNGFAQIDTWQDASYFGTWANPEKLIIFAYVEGDCYTTECENMQEFIDEIESIKKWNMESGGERGFRGIDPGLNPARIQKWNDIGLGHLLH